MVDGDSEAIQKLISDAQSAISALTYDESKTLAQNKSRVDAIMTKLATDVDNQRKADQLAADKATFETYKTSNNSTATGMIKDGDSDAVKKMVNDAKSAISALTYDESKSLTDNKSRVDAIMTKLATDVDNQRKAEQLAADKATFEAYKTSSSTAADDLILDGDGAAILKLVSDAKTTIAALTYDESKTLAQNKALVDAIMEQLVLDVSARCS